MQLVCFNASTASDSIIQGSVSENVIRETNQTIWRANIFSFFFFFLDQDVLFRALPLLIEVSAFVQLVYPENVNIRQAISLADLYAGVWDGGGVGPGGGVGQGWWLEVGRGRRGGPK